MSDFLWTVAFSVVFNLALFLPAYIFKTDKLTDISYALTFIAVAIYGFLGSERTIAHQVLLVMVLFWSVRLGSFLFIRIRKAGKDRRFDGMREHFFRFLNFWILQGITVPIVLLVSTLFLSQSGTSLSVVSAIGLFIFLSGLLIEAVADLQKYKFSTIQANKGKWIDSGLWSMSRHPNYLGEILVWVGIYVFCFTSLDGITRAIGAISPIYIATLLCFVSGIPLLEKSAEKKWGKDKAYQAYKKKTPVLVPFIKKQSHGANDGD